MPTEDVLIVLFCAVDDWLRLHPAPLRPGPKPKCADSEILTVALAREILGCDAERRFHRRLRREYRHLFPHLPAQSELNRRTRWLWRALEGLRQQWRDQLPAALGDWYSVDSTPLPVKQRHRANGRNDWQGMGLAASFGYCAAKQMWFYGFRLELVTTLIDQVPVTWGLFPAAGDERLMAEQLLTGLGPLALLADRGFRGREYTQRLADQGVQLTTPPMRRDTDATAKPLRAFIRAHRNRIESAFNTLKDRFMLERHRAHSVWGLLTRVAAKLAALTFVALVRHQSGLVLE